MLVPTQTLLQKAAAGNYAIGAFNVYNLEGALAVVESATETQSPVILQVLPSAIEIGGPTLIHLCLAAGKTARVPVSVHLDHCDQPQKILTALKSGISSVMADGSRLSFDDNIDFTRKIVVAAQQSGSGVEAELGRMTGTEDGKKENNPEEKMTDPSQARVFAEQTGAHALAVCIGNIHGKYQTPPDLDFERLSSINSLVDIPLVLHGTSGLPDQMIHKAVENGVCKFNVNTEVRSTYLKKLDSLFQKNTSPELVDVMKASIQAMKNPIKEKIELFGSAGKAA